MDNTKSLHRRIKQHVIGKKQHFFISTTPGLENLCLNELTDLSSAITDTNMVLGGIEFKAHIHDCYLANLCLRTANRILMRITGFHASNFRQMEKRLSQVPWELYLHRHTTPDIKVTSKHSRLYHKAAVAERILSAIMNHGNHTKSQAKSETTNSCSQKLFVRAIDDQFMISIDSSGDPLYKRGIKRHKAKAPVRETLAAAALKLAGYIPDEPLIDPMCGAGTFSLEAAMVSRNIPAGLYRDFAFMGWPAFRTRRWNYIKQEAEKNILPGTKTLVLASDKEKKAYTVLKKKVKDFDLSDIIKVLNKDFFELNPGYIEDIFKTKKKGLLIINPPYGVRLDTIKKSKRLVARILKKITKDYLGWNLALFITDTSIIRKIPFKIKTRTFDHGGLKLTLLTGKIT